MSKENRNAQLERISRQNKEKCAAFIVRMIEKYGKEKNILFTNPFPQRLENKLSQNFVSGNSQLK